MDFDLSDVEQLKDRSGDLRAINGTIRRLAARRKGVLEKDGPLARSKIAWKMSSYQQAVLYRVVALAEGVRGAWNARNVLVSFLAVRALVETIAVFDQLEQALHASIGIEDLSGIDALIMNRIFSTRDPAMLKGRPEHLAINVLSFVDKLEKRHGIRGIRSNYDGLSERCHPNSLGHHQFFSKADYETGSVTFSEQPRNLGRALDTIIPPLGLVSLFERSMDQLDQMILKVAEIQHRLNPAVRD
jgi:hypothetical protein